MATSLEAGFLSQESCLRSGEVVAIMMQEWSVQGRLFLKTSNERHHERGAAGDESIRAQRH